MSLVEAREKRDDARKVLAAGADPSTTKKEEKRQALLNAENIFEIVAREWHAAQLNRWSEGHAANILHRFEVDIFPYLGNRPLAEIDAPELLSILRKIEQRGAIDIPASRPRSRQSGFWQAVETIPGIHAGVSFDLRQSKRSELIEP